MEYLYNYPMKKSLFTKKCNQLENSLKRVKPVQWVGFMRGDKEYEEYEKYVEYEGMTQPLYSFYTSIHKYHPYDTYIIKKICTNYIQYSIVSSDQGDPLGNVVMINSVIKIY